MTAPTSACHTKQPLGCRARRCGPSATTRRRPSPPLCRPAPISRATPGFPARGDRGPVEPRTGARPPPPCRVHGAASGRPLRRPAGLPKSPFPWVPPASPRLAGFLSGISVSNPQIASPQWSLPTKSTSLNGGSLGSWVDEDRSKLVCRSVTCRIHT